MGDILGTLSMKSNKVTRRLEKSFFKRFCQPIRIKKSRKRKVPEPEPDACKWYVKISDDVCCKVPDLNDPDREDTACEFTDLLSQFDGTDHCSREIIKREVSCCPKFRFDFYTGSTFESAVNWQKRNKDWIQKILTCKGHARLEVYYEAISD